MDGDSLKHQQCWARGISDHTPDFYPGIVAYIPRFRKQNPRFSNVFLPNPRFCAIIRGWCSSLNTSHPSTHNYSYYQPITLTFMALPLLSSKTAASSAVLFSAMPKVTSESEIWREGISWSGFIKTFSQFHPRRNYIQFKKNCIVSFI